MLPMVRYINYQGIQVSCVCLSFENLHLTSTSHCSAYPRPAVVQVDLSNSSSMKNPSKANIQCSILVIDEIFKFGDLGMKIVKMINLIDKLVY